METEQNRTAVPMLKDIAVLQKTVFQLIFLFIRLNWRNIIWGLLIVITLAFGLATLLGFVNPFPAENGIRKWAAWGIELISHFRLQYLYVCILLSLAFLVLRRYKSAALAGAFGLINLALILPFYLGPTQPAPPENAFRALALNVSMRNTDYEGVLELIDETDPDFIVLSDIWEEWEVEMRPLLDKYPYSNHDRNEEFDGTVLYSKLPLVEPLEMIGTFRPSVKVRVQTDWGVLTLFGAHQKAPLSAGRTKNRSSQMDILAGVAAAEEEPVVLLGDLNTTPYSPIYRNFINDSGLRDARDGFGILNSWPTGRPFVAIPIDHALVSVDVIVHDLYLGPQVGSDHLPIILDFSVIPEGTSALN